MWAHLYSYWAVDPELMSAFPILRPCFRPCQSEMIYILKKLSGFRDFSTVMSPSLVVITFDEWSRAGNIANIGETESNSWRCDVAHESFTVMWTKAGMCREGLAKKTSSRQAFKRDQKQGHGFWKQTALIPKLKSATYFVDKWLYFLCHSFCIHSLRQDNGKCMKVKKSVDNACKYTTKNEQAPPHLAKNAKLLSSSVNVYGIIHFRDL